ncbi:hypothetical protein B0G81_5962 [Paraburkholderia sp. BL6665CI2N2]|nr:hypothetical protein B0G81_5962 [Paraburkholderia sp. BL6665CI2N2]
MIAVPFAHVTSIDRYTPCRGFGGFFAQFLYKRCSASLLRTKQSTLRSSCWQHQHESGVLGSIRATTFPKARSSQRHSHGDSLTPLGRHSQSRRNHLSSVRQVTARQRKLRATVSFQPSRDLFPDAYAANTSGAHDAAMPPMPSRCRGSIFPLRHTARHPSRQTLRSTHLRMKARKRSNRGACSHNGCRRGVFVRHPRSPLPH